MLTYKQSTGEVIAEAASTLSPNKLLGRAYSGHGEGLNNPAMQDVPYVGPIPEGIWSEAALTFQEYEDKGQFVIHLEPATGTETFGRSGFLIHGDNSKFDDSASEGCIVAPRWLRQRMWNEPDRLIKVVP